MLKDILKLKGVKELSKQQQNAVNGATESYCCFRSADHYMQDIPHYADPSYDEYMTHEERHEFWLFAYDACMAGLDIACVQAL